MAKQKLKNHYTLATATKRAIGLLSQKRNYGANRRRFILFCHLSRSVWVGWVSDKKTSRCKQNKIFQFQTWIRIFCIYIIIKLLVLSNCTDLGFLLKERYDYTTMFNATAQLGQFQFVLVEIMTVNRFNFDRPIVYKNL